MVGTIGVDILLPICTLQPLVLMAVLQEHQSAEIKIHISQRYPGGIEFSGASPHVHDVAMARSSQTGRDAAQPRKVEMQYVATQERREKAHQPSLRVVEQILQGNIIFLGQLRLEI